MARRLARCAGPAAAAAALLLVAAGPALAHAELISSTPKDQASLLVGPSRIELVFSARVQPAGDGIVLTDEAGAKLPAEVQQAAGERLLIDLGRALPPGGYRMSWTVRSGDTHPRSGSIGFAVATASPPPPGQRTAEGEASHPAGHVGGELPHSGEVPAVRSAEWLGRGARWVSLLGALLGIGVLAFAANSLTGSIPEVRTAAFWARRAGLAVVLGTMIDVAATAVQLHGAWGMGLAPSGLWSAIDGPFGVATLLKLGGGLAMLLGARLAVTPLPRQLTQSPAVRSPADFFSGPVRDMARSDRATDHRLNLGRSRLALGGAAAVGFSYLFDGHTVTSEPRWLMATADVAHVFGAGVWVGGVTLMAYVLRRRSRRRMPLRAGELAIRFSTVAGAALAVVALAGATLSVTILDSPRELVTTNFGRLLLLKLFAVAVAAGIGGYNHRFVIPALMESPRDGLASERLRSTVRAESWILVAVVGITAALVAAGS